MIGKQKLSCLLKHLGRRTKKLKPSMNSFHFADTVFESVGTIVLPPRTPHRGETILFEMDVVDADVPALLRMDAMNEHSLNPCLVTNTLVKRVVKQGKVLDIWSIRLIRAQSNNLFAPLECLYVNHFKSVQLHKLHRQLFHPYTDRLFNLIKKTRAEHATSETREALEEITARCDQCQRIRTAPLRFRVSSGAENVRFNERIIINIM